MSSVLLRAHMAPAPLTPTSHATLAKVYSRYSPPTRAPSRPTSPVYSALQQERSNCFVYCEFERQKWSPEGINSPPGRQ